jgi:hypothetical protein
LLKNTIVLFPITVKVNEPENVQLRVTFSWAANERDLDIRVPFLGEVMGFGYGGTSAYMWWSSDDTSGGGRESVTIDLAKARRDHRIAWDGSVTIDLAADWWEAAGGSGPADLLVEVLRENTVIGAKSKVIEPGRTSTKAATHVGTLTLDLQLLELNVD